MKKIIYILILTLFLTGCFNYRDVNRIIFVTALCIDIDEDYNPVLYVEAFSSTRTTGAPSGDETKILFKGTGKTVFEAIRNITNTAAVKLNYTQNKALIFTEKAAEYGLDHFLDVLFRDQEFLVRQFVYITNVDIEELLKIELKEETFIGVFLADLSENKPARTKKASMRIDELYISRKLGSKINGISLIETEKSDLVNRVDINKLAILNEDKLIDILKYDETFIYFLMTTNLINIAKENNINFAVDIYPMYGSDVVAALRGGNNIRGALIGPGVHASHGMERTHYSALENTIKLLYLYLTK